MRGVPARSLWPFHGDQHACVRTTARPARADAVTVRRWSGYRPPAGAGTA